MVDEALTETRAVQARIRELPSRVVVYLLLAACLFPELGYPAGVAPAAGRTGTDARCAAPTAGALCQARRRVGAAPLRWLFDLLRGPAAGIATTGTRWRGLLVCAIDGTTLSVPDSPANLTALRQAPLQQRRFGLSAAAARWPWWPAAPAPIIDAVFGPRPPARPPMRHLLGRSLRTGMIVLAGPQLRRRAT